jgi:hypothetical protein
MTTTTTAPAVATTTTTPASGRTWASMLVITSTAVVQVKQPELLFSCSVTADVPDDLSIHQSHRTCHHLHGKSSNIGTVNA